MPNEKPRLEVVRTEDSKKQTPETDSPAPPEKKKYTLADAFDYFDIPDDESPEACQLNNERCIRAVGFLLHYCSMYGNESVDGFIAHGLGHVLEQCASGVDRFEGFRKLLNEEV